MRWFGYNSFPRMAASLVFIFGVICTSAICSQDRIVNTTAWDFGYLSQKAEVTHTFYLRNTSDVPLIVTKIKDGCSCTSTSEVSEPIPPGDSAAIEVTFKSGRYKGKVTKTTKIYTIDDKNEAFRLSIKANVVKKLTSAETITVDPIRLKASVHDGDFRLTTDTVVICNSTGDTVTVALSDVSANLYLSGLPVVLLPGEQIGIPIGLQGLPAGDVEWIAGTLEFAAKDTLRVTIPVQIER